MKIKIYIFALCIMNNETKKITKKVLEKVHNEHFNKEKFLEVDPCGLVYELKQHTTRQLDVE